VEAAVVVEAEEAVVEAAVAEAAVLAPAALRRACGAATGVAGEPGLRLNLLCLSN
jgi:hypothetical protein